MTRGALLFAFNSPKYNYYDMAKFTAKRINSFLDLPVTLITDKDSLPVEDYFEWDKVIQVIPDKNNKRDWGQWINKGRYQAFKYTPYDETILLDVDYVINSNKLLDTFKFYDDFCCHNKTSYLMYPNAGQEVLSAYSYETLWATVVAFKKTKRTQQIFECLQMVQDNFSHYANIHNFIAASFRNDYALTLALKIANGHTDLQQDYIPWNLLHVGNNTKVYKSDETEYTVMFDNMQKGKLKKEYITVKDIDFHMMNKDNFMEIVNE